MQTLYRHSLNGLFSAFPDAHRLKKSLFTSSKHKCRKTVAISKGPNSAPLFWRDEFPLFLVPVIASVGAALIIERYGAEGICISVFLGFPFLAHLYFV